VHSWLSYGELSAQLAVLWGILCTVLWVILCAVGCPVGNSMAGFYKRRRGFGQRKERIRKHRVEDMFYASVLKVRHSALLHFTRKGRIYINVNEMGLLKISPIVEDERDLIMVKH
jgi:hypothetical protein